MVESLQDKDAGARNNFSGYNHQYRLAGRLWDLYVNNAAKYTVCRNGVIYQPKEKSNGRPQYLNMKKIQGHLAGFFNIGVFASNISAKFICFDIDVNDEELVLQVIARLAELGINRKYIYPSISGGKGYHVEVFIDKPVRNETLYKLYRAVVEGGGFDKHIVEFRPQKGLSVRMPLSDHYITGKTGWYCDVETLEPIEWQDYLFEIKQMKRDLFCDIVKRIKLKPNGIKKGSYYVKDPDHTILDAKEFQIPMVTEPHTRHSQMTRYAVWLRGGGFEQGEIYKRLMEWVELQDRSLMSSSDEEIEEDARLIAAWAGGKQVRNQDVEVIRSYGTVEFGFDDLNYVLNGKTKSDRRILFRSVLSQQLFGQDHVACRSIGWSMGMHQKTAERRIGELAAAGVIKVINGKKGKKEKTDRFFSIPNSYVPGDHVEQVLNADDFIGPWRMRERLRWRNALWLYATAMTAMLGDNLAKYVGRNEAEDIAHILAGGRPEATEVWENPQIISGENDLPSSDE